MTKYNKYSPYNLHGSFFYRTVILILAKKVTKNLPKFPQETFGQTQQQILDMSKISIHKLHGQFSTERSYMLIRLQMPHSLQKYPGKSKVRQNLICNHNWLKINGGNNYICYTCWKSCFSQFSEKWKDYIFRFWYCLSLSLSFFLIPSFFDIF